MPLVVVVVRILAVTYNIFGLVIAIPSQIEACVTAIMGQCQQVRDMETPLKPQNPWHVSLMDGGRPLKQWIGLLTAPYTHTPVQAGPTGSSKFGGS